MPRSSAVTAAQPDLGSFEATFREAFAAANLPAAYEEAARNTFRGEVARLFFAVSGDLEKTNAYLAPHGLRVIDLDAVSP